MSSSEILPHWNLPKEDQEFDSISCSIRILSNPQRLKILCKLGDGEADVQNITTYLGSKQSNISQQLNRMKDQGLLTSRKEANRVYYRINDLRTLRIISMVREVFCHSS
ncbi:ArsR/SmtB family transcription factor [Candidatus Venteria ishoeyi]|uniref:Biofilm growth-associated repressor n=1 Tax=Candidatus Venteria ishoeyi TaxID=1899563 RepID=A0A1H6F7M6_9GAMM|nr:metalloregulator ArsR/SmtB family transcription factor [Candidatus Venteria ishoeyi]MDM8547229.1 metalloregulator ArsR/SmtB family transcription factor [Candidatus Venteria ishoeyi]SEH05064.1 Biofilm growth-associated repressor [Candidatus Venteria ishoeyi]